MITIYPKTHAVETFFKLLCFSVMASTKIPKVPDLDDTEDPSCECYWSNWAYIGMAAIGLVVAGVLLGILICCMSSMCCCTDIAARRALAN